jgi:extracellular factor (EF) 3-hydroxypalmitic acid methyl ester biosynthesis protein
MTSISTIKERFVSLQPENLVDEVSFFHKVTAVIHELCAEIRQLEILGAKPEEIIYELKEIRSIFGRSVFLSRIQNWPRGYQGDFETIEYLCDGVNTTSRDTLEYYLEKLALSSPIAQQHTNKLLWQSQQVLNTIYTNPIHEKKILSIGSGGCRDLRLIKPILRNSSIKLIINDIDKDAIDYSKKHLQLIWQKITPIHGNAYRKVREISKHAPFDLIIVGGLFDYLSDRYIGALINKLATMLAKPGKICFTNILSSNPWRVLIEYLADWHLLERTERDFRMILDSYRLYDLEIRMTSDRTGLTGLFEISSLSS